MKHSIERFPITTMVNGGELALTIHTFEGGSGPTVGISAAVHGDETIGPEAIRRLVGFLQQPDVELSGTLRVLPVANPLAYETNSRHTVTDHMNLNRTYPGDADGWLTEQLAHTMFTHFIPGLEYYLDLHSGGAYPVVDYVYLLTAPELSRAFGSKLLFQPPPSYPGTVLTGAKGGASLPRVVVELGGGLFNEEHYAQRYFEGIVNALRRLGVLSGQAKPAPRQILMHEIATIRPHQGGLLVPEVHVPDLGSEVPGGTVLGRIYSPYTFELLEEIRAPFGRNLLVLLRDNLAPIQPGNYMYMIGNGDTAEVLPAEA